MPSACHGPLAELEELPRAEAEDRHREGRHDGPRVHGDDRDEWVWSSVLVCPSASVLVLVVTYSSSKTTVGRSRSGHGAKVPAGRGGA
jgi:hypothetical protein